MVIAEIKSTEIIVLPNQAVFTDKRTGVKTIAFPFTFPNGENGIISVTKLVKMNWIPSDDIATINLNFK